MYKNIYINILKNKTRILLNGLKMSNFLTKYTKYNLQHQTILDIGCGNGFIEFGLAKYCKNIVGIDPSYNMIQDAIQNLKNFPFNNIQFLQFYIEDFINLNYKFDIIIFSYSFHLIDNNIEILQQLKKILKPSGYIYIMEATKTFISERFNFKSKSFNKKQYDEKQLILKEARFNLKKYLNKKNIIFEEINDKIYHVLFNI